MPLFSALCCHGSGALAQHQQPFYADFIVEEVNGELVPNQQTIRRLFQTFHLAELIPQHAENLKQLRAVGYHWGRNDPNQSHVYGARKMTTLAGTTA